MKWLSSSQNVAALLLVCASCWEQMIHVKIVIVSILANESGSVWLQIYVHNMIFDAYNYSPGVTLTELQKRGGLGEEAYIKVSFLIQTSYINL